MIASMVRSDVETLDALHIVHVIDPYLDVPLAFGPFATPELATNFAASYELDVRYEGCEEPVTVTIVPLRPA